MRGLLTIIFAFIATPAFAQGWDHYDNARFGYGMDTPPGFISEAESDNGDGQSFYNPAGAQGLLVWGGNLMDDFESEVSAAMDYATAEDGYGITYQATTPRWASFSGVNGSHILYQRMVLLCDGTGYAAFRAEYSTKDAAEMNATIERLVQSLKGKDC